MCYLACVRIQSVRICLEEDAVRLASKCRHIDAIKKSVQVIVLPGRAWEHVLKVRNRVWAAPGRSTSFAALSLEKTRMNRGDTALQIRTLFNAFEAVQKN